ncbi:MAG: bile acid:sodium symporter family protein [Rhodobacteraceae bacterium]|nr:bile acid:sodium symporter family protein [Paracoccaceae bacterium]
MTSLLAALLPLGLILLMFVVGLRLSLTQVIGAFSRPKALSIGLLVQLIVLPAAAFLLSRVLALPAPMAAGLILVAAAPGGVTSNYIAHLARADLALSAAMTLVTTALASITIPLVLTLTGAAELPGAAGLMRMSMIMAGVATLPMGAGMALAAWRPGWANWLGVGLEPASKIIFAAMVLATFIQNWPVMMQHISSVGPAVLALNLIALSLAGAAGFITRLGAQKRRAIMVEASLQNVAVALFVAGTLLDNPAMSVPALIYALVMNISALAQIAMAHKWVGPANLNRT